MYLHIKHILCCSIDVLLCMVFQFCLAHLALKCATGLYHPQNFGIFHPLILKKSVFAAFGMEISEILDISHKLFFPVQNSIFALLCILMLHTCMVIYTMSSMFLNVHTSKMYYVCHHILGL